MSNFEKAFFEDELPLEIHTERAEFSMALAKAVVEERSALGVQASGLDQTQELIASASLVHSILEGKSVEDSTRFMLSQVDLTDLLGVGTEISDSEYELLIGTVGEVVKLLGSEGEIEVVLMEQVQAFSDKAHEKQISRAEVVSDPELYKEVKRELAVSPAKQLQDGYGKLEQMISNMTDGDFGRAIVELIVKEDRPFASEYTLNEEVDAMHEEMRKEIALFTASSSLINKETISLIHKSISDLWGEENLGDEYWTILENIAEKNKLKINRPDSEKAEKTEVDVRLHRQLDVAARLGFSSDPAEWGFAEKMDISFELSKSGYNRDGSKKKNSRY